MSHLLMSIFIVCKDGKKTYRSGENFVKDDCSENCTCLPFIHAGRRRRSIFEEIGSVGFSACSPLCNARQLRTQCAVGLRVEEYRNKVDGTNCVCNESKCVKRK